LSKTELYIQTFNSRPGYTKEEVIDIIDHVKRVAQRHGTDFSFRDAVTSLALHEYVKRTNKVPTEKVMNEIAEGVSSVIPCMDTATDLLSDIIDSSSLDNEKERKFKEFERRFAGDRDMINSSKAVWLASRGNEYGKQGNIDQAISDFKESIEFKKDYIPSYVGLGISYREKGMFQEALQVVKNAKLQWETYEKWFSADQKMAEHLDRLMQELEGK